MAALGNLLKSRRPGWSLEQPFYTDPAIFKSDMERVYRRGWLFAGHACQVSQPGDYFTYDVAGDSLIIIRGNDGALHALFNVCRHRGSRICLAPAGRATRLICPYHQWTYDTDGTLLHNTWMPEAFEKSAFGLAKAHVRNIVGLIFVSMAEDPPTFAPEHDFTLLLKPHGLERAKLAHSMTYDIPANWKLVIENQRECYHCPAKHKGYAKIQLDTDVDDADKRDAIAQREAESRDKWAALGLDVSLIVSDYAMNGLWWRANRTPFRAGNVSETSDGQPIAPLMGAFTDADGGNARANIYPNFWLHGSSDHVHTMRVTPIDQSTTRVQADWLVHEAAEAGIDYEVARLIEFSKRVNDEDHVIVTDQARGVASSRYRPGPYSPVKEALAEHFVAWYIKQLAG
jgi:Rieske 2Fe-2S family protein